MKERSTLWIHSQIKACMDPGDCQPDYCLDLFEPSGTTGKYNIFDNNVNDIYRLQAGPANIVLPFSIVYNSTADASIISWNSYERTPR